MCQRPISTFHIELRIGCRNRAHRISPIQSHPAAPQAAAHDLPSTAGAHVTSKRAKSARPLIFSLKVQESCTQNYGFIAAVYCILRSSGQRPRQTSSHGRSRPFWMLSRLSFPAGHMPLPPKCRALDRFSLFALFMPHRGGPGATPRPHATHSGRASDHKMFR